MSNYTRLSMRERCNLTIFLDMRLSISEIAKRMNRHRSTLYRELRRNHTQGHYRPGLAHAKAQSRRPRKRLKLQTTSALYYYVYEKLIQGWSPEQIVGRMRLQKKPYDVCHETIYRYIYRQGRQGLYRYLPSRRDKRRRQHGRKKQQCRYGDIRLITHRPDKIALRTHFGHWEGDLIEFAGSKKKTVTTLVERKSRWVTLLKNTSKTSASIMDKVKKQFTNNPILACKTITFDQGSEFADYRQVEHSVGCKIYYCEVASPWQKGSNENMNGRLRRYLPKKINIDQFSQKELDQIANKMNTLPRKCLGFRTPREVLFSYYPRPCRTKK